jgi:hypothetical protein
VYSVACRILGRNKASAQNAASDTPQGLNMTIDPNAVIGCDELDVLSSAVEIDGSDDIHSSEK